MIKILYFNCLAIILTYMSLLYQKYILIDRIIVDKLEKIEVIAGGFPLEFLVDGETSPAGSISIDPIFIFIGMDQFVFLNFFIDYLFWVSVLFTFYMIVKNYKTKYSSQN